MNEYGIGVIRCHWDKDFRCGVGRMCRGCEHQPEDDDKPNGKMPPVKLLWAPTLNAAGDAFIPDGEPKCPASAGEWADNPATGGPVFEEAPPLSEGA